MEDKIKKAKVILLPTGLRTQVGEITTNTTMPTSLFVMNERVYNAWSRDSNSNFKHLRGNYLYFTIDESPKEGDFYYDRQGGIGEYTGGSKYLFWDKIIGTNDPKLKIKEYTGVEDTNGIKEVIEHNLPSPSKDFILKYCNKGGIDEVIVDYINLPTGEQNFDGDGIWEKVLKVDLMGDITTHPVKDSWNREEVVLLLEKICDVYTHSLSDEGFQDWIEDNLYFSNLPLDLYVY